MATQTVFYLRRKGTNLVFIRTARLARRDDMESIDKKKADELLAQQGEDSQNLRDSKSQEAAFGPDETHRAPTDDNDDKDGPKAVPLSKQKLPELRKLAADLKVAHADDATKPELIKLIKKAQAADEAEAVGEVADEDDETDENDERE